MSVLGYKAMNADMTCRGFQFAVGETYHVEGPPVPCKNGFHFCKNLGDVFEYYGRFKCILFEVEALGDVVTDGTKSCTDRLKILRRLDPMSESRAPYGCGCGYGYGCGNGNGDGDGYGYGYGYGDSDGDGYGDGNGYGDGCGYGDSDSDGCGNGDGNGYGHKINNVLVWKD